LGGRHADAADHRVERYAHTVGDVERVALAAHRLHAHRRRAAAQTAEAGHPDRPGSVDLDVEHVDAQGVAGPGAAHVDGAGDEVEVLQPDVFDALAAGQAPVGVVARLEGDDRAGVDLDGRRVAGAEGGRAVLG